MSADCKVCYLLHAVNAKLLTSSLGIAGLGHNTKCFHNQIENFDSLIVVFVVGEMFLM